MSQEDFLLKLSDMLDKKLEAQEKRITDNMEKNFVRKTHLLGAIISSLIVGGVSGGVSVKYIAPMITKMLGG